MLLLKIVFQCGNNIYHRRKKGGNGKQKIITEFFLRKEHIQEDQTLLPNPLVQP